jgi:hypothetical protein
VNTSTPAELRIKKRVNPKEMMPKGLERLPPACPKAYDTIMQAGRTLDTSVCVNDQYSYPRCFVMFFVHRSVGIIDEQNN